MDEHKRKKPVWKRVLLVIGIVLFVLLLILLASAGAVLNYMDGMMDKMNYVTGDTTVSPEVATSIDQEEWIPIPSDVTDPVVDWSDVTFTTQPASPEELGDHVVNILLVGQDARPGEPPQRSDSMIMITFNKITGQIMLTSFTRDQYVQIPGFGATKLCHAYAYGGMTLLNQTIYDHYGVEIDGNVTVSFEGFAGIVDMLGGVDVNMTEAEAKEIRRLSGGKWKLTPGMNHLTGEQALAYSRIRYIGNGDFERTDRQRKVLTALLDKCRDMSIPELNDLLWTALPMLSTDLTDVQIISYALELLPLIKDLKVQTQRIPADGTFQFANIKNMEVLLPNLEKNRELLKAAMLIEPET